MKYNNKYIIFLFIFFYKILIINSRTSVLWKLNAEEGKIKIIHSVGHVSLNNLKSIPFIVKNDIRGIIQENVKTYNQGCDPIFDEINDPIFSIITSTVTVSGDTWRKYPDDMRACGSKNYYK